jgi:hypothetical protein
LTVANTPIKTSGFQSISTLQHSDPETQRALDEIKAKVNPIMRSLPNGIGNNPTVTGNKGSNAALTNLIAQLAAMGLITDGTT